MKHQKNTDRIHSKSQNFLCNISVSQSAFRYAVVSQFESNPGLFSSLVSFQLGRLEHNNRNWVQNNSSAVQLQLENDATLYQPNCRK